VARLPKSAKPPDGMRWLAREEIAGAALPSLMRKVLAHANVEGSSPPRNANPAAIHFTAVEPRRTT
jgi:hypothetical protein